MAEIWLDVDGFLYAGGVKVARWDPRRGVLEFLDKSGRRSVIRGSRRVTIQLDQLTKLLQPDTEGD